MENLRRVDSSEHTMHVGAATDMFVTESSYYLPVNDSQEGTIVAFDAETAARRSQQKRSDSEQQRRLVAPLVTAETIVDIYTAGLSLEETADRLGVTTGDVRRALAQEEVGVRDRKAAARASWREEVKETRVAKVHTPESDALRREKLASLLQDQERRAEIRRQYHDRFLKNVVVVFGEDPQSKIVELLRTRKPPEVAMQLGIPVSFLTRVQKYYGVKVESVRSTPGPQIQPKIRTMFHRLVVLGLAEKILTRRQLEVCRLRYGDVPLTQDEIARKYGVNRQSVQQVEKRGVKRMKTAGVGVH